MTRKPPMPAEPSPLGFAPDRLRGLIERIEHLHEERKALGSDIADIFAEAKSAGFDPKAMKVCIARRRHSQAENDQLDALVALYMGAIAADAGRAAA